MGQRQPLHTTAQPESVPGKSSGPVTRCRRLPTPSNTAPAPARGDGDKAPGARDSYEARASARLTRELAGMAPWGSAAFWAQIYGHGEGAPSCGTLAHLIGAAGASQDADMRQEIFTALVARCARRIAAWAAGVVARTPDLVGTAAYAVREDLCQELTLYLWQQLSCHPDDAWALYFARALAYAQGHVAARSMQRNGLWVRPGVRRPSRGRATTMATRDEREQPISNPHGKLAAVPRDLAAADLADLRDLAFSLPARERLAVVMRFWHHAPDAEIAIALGGVTTRTVRNVLHRAYARLRAQYVGFQDVEKGDQA